MDRESGGCPKLKSSQGEGSKFQENISTYLVYGWPLIKILYLFFQFTKVFSDIYLPSHLKPSDFFFFF